MAFELDTLKRFRDGTRERKSEFFQGSTLAHGLAALPMKLFLFL